MSSGFGFSAGDIVSGIILVKDLILALEDSKGSSKDYLDLISELRSLESALLAVKKLRFVIPEYRQEVELREAVVTCRVTIDDFLSSLSKYHPYLRQNGSLQPWRDALSKIQWRLCTRDNITKFRSRISIHTQALQILLFTIQIQQSSIQEENVRDQSLMGVAHGQTLEHIQANLEQLIETARNSFHILHGLQINIPPQILFRQPVIFRDALDRVAPIHLDWINSWEAFQAVLRVRFKDVGLGKVERLEYVLQPSDADRKVEIFKNWGSSFRPGEHVNMSMVFRDAKRASSAHCPGCHLECEGDTTSEIQCQSCGLTFQRVQEMLRQENVLRADVPRNETFSISRGLQKQPAKRPLPEDVDDEDRIQAFRRVKLLKESNRREDALAVVRNLDKLPDYSPELSLVSKSQKHVYVIRCICLQPEINDVSTIRCGSCHTWQHAQCYAEFHLITTTKHRCIDCNAAQSDSSGTRHLSTLKSHEYVIRCICGFPSDNLVTVLCPICETWRHITCHNGEFATVCLECDPRPFDYVAARLRRAMMLRNEASAMQGERLD